MNETSTRNSILEARSLTKVFRDKKLGKVKAVDDVSFDCREGEIYGLLGPNGAGKTTTLRMLSTALRPTSGDATICGFDLRNDARKVRSSIGFLSGSTGLYGRLSPREVMQYFGSLYGMDKGAIRERCAELFSLLGIESFADRRCDKLSSGMKQKVSIVRSILHDPPVMIFDEPTTGLDVLTSRTILSFIRECRDRKKCVILSTHIMSEAEKLCDHIGVIHEAKIRERGTPREILDRHKASDLEEAFVRILEETS
ncbi:MAG: ATP-binding cassette domain-containing protein [Planctomycetota bacterium]|nr:ATP-binding cassette domain-containing protein [Planctomycetota bacterium]